VLHAKRAGRVGREPIADRGSNNNIGGMVIRSRGKYAYTEMDMDDAIARAVRRD
jgi:hypothetical protein